MSRGLILALLLLGLGWLALGELAARADFMAAMSWARQGRPLVFALESLYFAWRLIVLVSWPSLVTGLVFWRLTKS